MMGLEVITTGDFLAGIDLLEEVLEVVLGAREILGPLVVGVAAVILTMRVGMVGEALQGVVQMIG